MQPDKFQLNMYTTQIMQIAQEQKCTPEKALTCFLKNLATMKEHYKGAQGLNYHALGQQWNQLPSESKVAQKAEVLARLSKYAK